MRFCPRVLVPLTSPKPGPSFLGYKRRCRVDQFTLSSVMQTAQFSSRTSRRNTPSLSSVPIPSPKSFTSDQQRMMPSFGRTRTPNSGYLKQTDEWLMAAQESTENFKTYGSRLPVVWVGGLAYLDLFRTDIIL